MHLEVASHDHGDCNLGSGRVDAVDPVHDRLQAS